MAEKLSKIGIDTDSAISASYVDNTINALTGTKAYNIAVSGSSTITGSLKILGNITNTEDLTTVGVITAQSNL